MLQKIVIPFLTLLCFAATAQSENSKNEKPRVSHKASIKDRKRYKYFCANATVTMADGTRKPISDVKVGEKVKTCHKGKSMATKVKEVEVYTHPDAALTAVYLRPAEETMARGETWPLVPALLLEATPHHQVQTNKGNKTMKQLSKNDILYHYEPETGEVSGWKVGVVQTNARKVNTAYNLTTEEGSYLVENMIVLNK
jgi:ribosomal 50S subunit-recycling heat shock protein